MVAWHGKECEGKGMEKGRAEQRVSCRGWRSGSGSGSLPDSQAVVMAMTASGLAALGLSHIRHSVKLLFAIAMRGKRGE